MSFKLGAAAAACVFLLLLIFSSFYTVNPGEVGVVVTAGQVVGVAQPGMNLKAPFITSVPTISTRDNVVSFPGLTAYTSDQQTATVTAISVNYRIDATKAEEIYKRFGSSEAMVDQLVSRRVNEALEKVFGQYTAVSAVQKRTQLSIDLGTLIRQVDGPLTITSVQLENFSLPDAYEKNINDQLAAEVRVKQASAQAQQTVIEAQAQADSQLAIATAAAKAVILAGDAQASAIRAKAEALKDNPNLIDLTKAEKWNGVLPTTMVPGSAVPFLDVTPSPAPAL